MSQTNKLIQPEPVKIIPTKVVPLSNIDKTILNTPI